MSYPHPATRCAEHHDLVVDFGAVKPPIVVLCGSTRFHDAFRLAEYEAEQNGIIALSVGFDPDAIVHSGTVGITSARKTLIDNLHKRKIDMADWVKVLNVGGYLGPSTRAEIAYAERIGKPVRYLEPIDGIDGGTT